MPDDKDKDKKKKSKSKAEDELVDQVGDLAKSVGLDLGDLNQILNQQYGDDVLLGQVDVTSPVWESHNVHDQTTTVADLLKTFFAWRPEQLRAVQAIMFAAGYYGDANVNDIRWGVADDQSFSAWSAAVASAARYRAAGRREGPEDIILNAAEAAGVDVDEFHKKMESLNPAEWFGPEDLPNNILHKSDPIQVMLSDPNALRQTIDRSAAAVLGRKATPAEQRAFVSMIHSVQRTGQTALQTAGQAPFTFGAAPTTTETGDGSDYRARADTAAAGLGLDDTVPPPEDLTTAVTTEYAAPDEAADAEAFLRAQNPTEAGAHDIAIQMANFIDLLGAPVDIPSLTLG